VPFIVSPLQRFILTAFRLYSIAIKGENAGSDAIDHFKTALSGREFQYMHAATSRLPFREGDVHETFISLLLPPSRASF
jgi:hypothetical protein